MKFIHFRLLIMLGLIQFCFGFNQNNINPTEEVTYILTLKYPKHIKNYPKINGNYKGYRIEFENELCLIPQTKSCNQFILVVTQEINPKIEGNKVKYFERLKDNPCRLFYISNCSQTNEKLNWIIEEEKHQNIPLRLPEDAILILMNSDYIENINPINFQDESLKYLLEIIVKKNISQEELDQESIYSTLSSMNSNAFSSSLIKKSKEEDGVVISKISSVNI